MDIALTGDAHLVGLGVVFVGQGTVFFQQLCDTGGDLVFVALCLGLDCALHEGLRELDRRVLDIVSRQRQRVVGVGVGELRDHTDITAAQGIDFGLLLTGHRVDVTELFVLTGRRVAQNHRVVQLAVHDLEEGHLTDERVGDGLEDEDGGRAGRFDRRGVFHVVNDNDFFLLCGRTREGVGDLIHQHADTPELGRGAAVNGNDVTGDDAFVNGKNRFVVGDFFAAEVLFHQIVRGLGDGFEQHVAVFVSDRLEFFGNRGFFRNALLVVNDRAHVDEVQKADDLVAFDHGNQDRTDGNAERFAQLRVNALEASFTVIELVDVERTRNACILSLLPGKLRTDFDTGLTVNDDHGSVRNAHRLVNFTDKVKVTGSIEQVDLDAVPHNGSNGGRYGKSALDFFVIIVADGVAVGRIAQTVGCLCQIQHCLSERGFAGRRVTDEGDVSDFFCG